MAPVEYHQNASLLFLVAVPHGNTSTSRFLGSPPDAAACASLCLAVTPRCYAFTHYGAEYEVASGHFDYYGPVREANVRGQCFGVVTPQWSPTPRPGATTGRVLRPCEMESDCSHNGRCVEGRCDCDAAWSGRTCDQLRISPTPESAGYAPVDGGQGTSTWKGSVARGEDGRYHMWASELTHHCGIDAWLANSRIVHAVSDSGVDGSYRRVDVVYDAYATEPHVVRATAVYSAL